MQYNFDSYSFLEKILDIESSDYYLSCKHIFLGSPYVLLYLKPMKSTKHRNNVHYDFIYEYKDSGHDTFSLLLIK